MLNTEEKKELLDIARNSILDRIRNKRRKEINPKSEKLLEHRGAFVTLHEKDGGLRGCIGMMNAADPLCETVRNMAVEAAFNDPRFTQLTKEEFEAINIEISILSPLKKINDAGEIKLGEHGVMVKKGFRSGVFLPQVAIETGWTLDEFMSNLCSGKAGLDPDAWEKSGIDVYIFTVEIVSEDKKIN
jgi:AmmeMemoRadiSam system protein A